MSGPGVRLSASIAVRNSGKWPGKSEWGSVGAIGSPPDLGRLTAFDLALAFWGFLLRDGLFHGLQPGGGPQGRKRQSKSECNRCESHSLHAISSPEKPYRATACVQRHTRLPAGGHSWR